MLILNDLLEKKINKKNLLIIGEGGLGHVVQQAAEHEGIYTVIGYADDKNLGVSRKEGLIYTSIEAIHELKKHSNLYFIVAIGDGNIREKIINQLQLPKEKFATIIHPTAFVDSNATIGNGVAIMPHAIVHSAACIKDHVIVNSASIIEHRCFIYEFVSISPNATLCGAVMVGRSAFIGAGVTVIQCLDIGGNTTIGAGSVVLSSIDDNCIAYGTPAVVKKKKVHFRVDV